MSRVLWNSQSAGMGMNRDRQGAAGTRPGSLREAPVPLGQPERRRVGVNRDRQGAGSTLPKACAAVPVNLEAAGARRRVGAPLPHRHPLAVLWSGGARSLAVAAHSASAAHLDSGRAP
jgi:hypothetical protein